MSTCASRRSSPRRQRPCRSSRAGGCSSASGSGAARGGQDLRRLEVCHFTTCYVAEDRAAALHEAKRMLARYANLPFYGNMLAASGFAAEVDAVRAAWRTRDVAAAEQAVTDEM